MLKRSSNGNNGFSAIELILVVVALGLIGFTSYYAYHTYHKTTSTQPVSTSDTPKRTGTADSTDTSSKNAGYLVMSEWNLRFKVPSGLTDVKYVINGDEAAFYAKPTGADVQYISGYDSYADNNFTHAIGVMYQSSSASKAFSGDEMRQGKKVGNHYYYTSWAFSSLASGAGCVGLYGDSESACQTEAKAFQLINQGDAALLNTIELAD